MSFLVDESQINPHQQPAIVAARETAAANEEFAAMHVVQRRVRAELKEVAARIKELKKVRSTPGQPGWQGSPLGLELAHKKDEATILCVSRSRARGRYHSVMLPRVFFLPPAGGVFRATEVRTRSELAWLSDAWVAGKFGPYAVVDQLTAEAEKLGQYPPKSTP